MAWIGGIFSGVSVSQEEVRNKLDLMMETACPPNGSSTIARPEYVCSRLDQSHTCTLVRASLPIEGTQTQHVHTGHEQRLGLIYDGYFCNSEAASFDLSQVQHRIDGTSAESLVRLLARFPCGLAQKVSQALTGLDGDYALAVSDGDCIVISRNPLGTRPLYFAEDERFSAFASNKKPLWKMGLDEVRPLRAATLATLHSGGIGIQEASRLNEGESNVISMAEAVDEYEQALCSAVRKRLAEMNHIPRVGVLLSGGVDSCLIAKLVHDVASGLGMETITYTVGLPDSPDVSSAREFAEAFGMKHEVEILSIGVIERYIPEVIEAIEDSDFVQIETGIGIYAAVDMASQDGVRVIFSGQGADEQWGGYSWYPRVLGKDGRQELDRRMWDDFARTDVETLDRENKIAMAYGVEMLFPYLDTEVVNVAMSVASELKVVSEDDCLGKHPHRQLAMKVGIPEKYSNRKKLAIQHGTGIHGVLDHVARRNGFDLALVKDIGFKNEQITDLRMGSSARYGYRYTEKKLWQVPQHVQLYLHALAYRQGLLDKSTRDRVGHLLRKARLPYGTSV